jgi:hypothetical protein
MFKEIPPAPQPFEKELNNAWAIALETYPELSILKTEKIGASQEDFLQYTAGEFVASNDSQKVLIRMVLGDISHLEGLRTARKSAIEIIAKKLGTPPERIDNKVLSLLIFLHEVGHGRDYILNYLKNPLYQNTDDLDKN